jgi:hypothetical protein
VIRAEAPPRKIEMIVARVPAKWGYGLWRIPCPCCAEDRRNHPFVASHDNLLRQMHLEIVDLRFAYQSGLCGARVFVGECPRCYQRYYGESQR